MSTADNTARDQRDVYSRVMSQIVNAIDQGVSMRNPVEGERDSGMIPNVIPGRTSLLCRR
jgi:hypothetical protein